MKRLFIGLCMAVVAIGTAIGWTVEKASSRPSLDYLLKEALKGRDLRAGIAVIINGRDTVCVNNDYRYPMMSVFKLHQAMAVMNYCYRKRIGLDTQFTIGKNDLKPDTYSPLRDRFPDGNFRLSIRELLQYTLHLSDNNACDILFDRTVSPEETDRYLRTSLGLEHFAIAATEDDMHRNPELCHSNWTTPLEAARLIEKLFTKELTDTAGCTFLTETLKLCRTGTDRLAAGLEGTEAVLGHKTGTSDRDSSGRLTGINDAGFVLLPDGRRYTIAVFVTQSAESMEETSALIAELSRITYRYISEAE